MGNGLLRVNAWRVGAMLATKGWLETRWRLTNVFVLSAFFLAISYEGRQNPHTARVVLLLIWLVLSCMVMTLAGSGVKSQSSIGFPQGLAESTQFTISLPVSRMALLAVRAGVGLLETFAATVTIAWMAWELFPTIPANMPLADFVRLALTTLLWLPLPYCAALLFEAFVVEPLSFVLAGWTLTLLLWLLHNISPTVDVIRAFGQASPLLTHRLPLSQLATADLLAATILLGAVWVVRRHEY
jgi:hypothetical protein